MLSGPFCRGPGLPCFSHRNSWGLHRPGVTQGGHPAWPCRGVGCEHRGAPCPHPGPCRGVVGGRESGGPYPGSPMTSQISISWWCGVGAGGCAWIWALSVSAARRAQPGLGVALSCCPCPWHPRFPAAPQRRVPAAPHCCPPISVLGMPLWALVVLPSCPLLPALPRPLCPARPHREELWVPFLWHSHCGSPCTPL